MNESEVPPLSDAYHRSRRQLVLWVAILLCWEVLDISRSFTGSDGSLDPDKLGRVNDYVRTFFELVGNLERVVVALFVLIAYFGARTWIEWNQCHPDRRNITQEKSWIRKFSKWKTGTLKRYIRVRYCNLRRRH